jgi:hypothetical protein
MLPGRVIATIGDATELNVVSHELDRSLFSRLPRTDGNFTVRRYCAAYRWAPDRSLPRARSDSFGKSARALTTTWESLSSARRSR